MHVLAPHLDLLGRRAHVRGVLVVDDDADDGRRAELAVRTLDQREGAVLQSTAAVSDQTGEVATRALRRLRLPDCYSLVLSQSAYL